jgi:hypothetical protein
MPAARNRLRVLVPKILSSSSSLAAAWSPVASMYEPPDSLGTDIRYSFARIESLRQVAPSARATAELKLTMTVIPEKRNAHPVAPLEDW